VFKILGVEDDCFTEILNLRVGKNLNLNYSCNDVAWNTLDENVIATGATNGAVVLWNLSKITRAKQEHVFCEHKRTVHKVIIRTYWYNI
jgi:WD40 repeat protein